MKLKSLNFFSRAALLLLTMMLTTATAWADAVTLSVDGDIAEGTAGHYYVNMPANGTNTLTLADASITTFKVYDNGGKDGDYSTSSKALLVITVPGGYNLQFTGTIFDCSNGNFGIWDGTSEEDCVEMLVSESGAQNVSVNATSGTRNVVVAFYPNNADAKQGFDITVTLVDAPKHNISFASVANGSATATIGGTVVTQAREGETVTVTATPADGYLLDNATATCGDDDVAVTLSPWTNSATFTMPTSDVTVTPVFAASAGYEITIPATGTKRIAVPASVTSFHVYDDGGSNGNYSPNCNGELYLYLPSGYKFHLEGTITNDATTGDYLSVYKDNGTNEVYRFRSATAGEPKAFTYDYDADVLLRFISNGTDQYSGLDLTVSLVGNEYAVTVNNPDGVGGSVVTASVGGTAATTATAGQTVTLTSSPAEGYVLGALSVRDADGNIVDVTGDMLWYTDATTATFTMPASAVTVTPVFTSVMTAAAGLTVNMPKKNVRNVTIPEGVTSFKVYDYGGDDCNYLGKYGQRLRLTAPDGCALQIAGTVTTKGGGATTFIILDGIGNDTDDYLVNHAASATDGAPVTIPAVVSSGESIYLSLYTSDDGDDLASLDLTVTVITGGVDHDVSVATATGGTLAASPAAAPLGQTVTLTATPTDGYVLSGLSVTTGGREVKTDWNVWTNSATFRMPDGDVTVTPTFTSDLTGLAVCLPVNGNKYVTIPEGVASFKIYDDGGASGDYTPYCNGSVYMTAAEGSHLRITGSFTGPEDMFGMTIDNTTFSTTTGIDITSTATEPSVGLRSTLNAATGAGLDLTATVLYAVTIGSGTANGTVATDKTHAAAGETVTLSVTPAEDCTVGTVAVNGQPLAAVQGVYSFQMPARRVSVSATFYPNITLDFAEGQTWATYYHEEGVTYSVSEGAQAYYVSSIGESTVNLTAIDGVPSGLPVLISGSGTVTLTADASAEVDVTDNDARFQGTPTALSATDFTDFTDGRTYVLYGGRFLLVEANSGIGAHKCWLTLNAPTTARQLNISVGETTGITPTPDPSRAGGEWYTLDGRKLGSEPTRKGLYIYKGKKVKK